MTAPLRRVLVRAPDPAALAGWREYGWRAEPDAARALREHEALCRILAEAGAKVIVGAEDAGPNPDAIYAHDPSLVTDRGAIVLRPGKEGRRGEARVAVADLQQAGVPVLAQLEAPATAEAGDAVWLDPATLLVGRTYRTNDSGIAALRRLLSGVEIVELDLPHGAGPGTVVHLMSFLSLLADDLAVAHLPLLPVRLVELLRARDVRIVEVPEEELETMGPNVLALAPRVALALAGNGETRRRLERAGVEVLVYEGEEISRKGDGGPTCLTRPLLRSP